MIEPQIKYAFVGYAVSAELIRRVETGDIAGAHKLARDIASLLSLQPVRSTKEFIVETDGQSR